MNCRRREIDDWQVVARPEHPANDIRRFKPASWQHRRSPNMTFCHMHIYNGPPAQKIEKEQMVIVAGVLLRASVRRKRPLLAPQASATGSVDAMTHEQQIAHFMTSLDFLLPVLDEPIFTSPAAMSRHAIYDPHFPVPVLEACGSQPRALAYSGLKATGCYRCPIPGVTILVCLASLSAACPCSIVICSSCSFETTSHPPTQRS
jgi:hypothetical protein